MLLASMRYPEVSVRGRLVGQSRSSPLGASGVQLKQTDPCARRKDRVWAWPRVSRLGQGSSGCAEIREASETLLRSARSWPGTPSFLGSLPFGECLFKITARVRLLVWAEAAFLHSQLEETGTHSCVAVARFSMPGPGYARMRSGISVQRLFL